MELIPNASNFSIFIQIWRKSQKKRLGEGPGQEACQGPKCEPYAFTLRELTCSQGQEEEKAGLCGVCCMVGFFLLKQESNCPVLSSKKLKF